MTQSIFISLRDIANTFLSMQVSKQIFTAKKSKQNGDAAGEQIQYAPWCCHSPTQRDGFPALSKCVGSEDGQFLASYDAKEQTKTQTQITYRYRGIHAPTNIHTNIPTQV